MMGSLASVEIESIAAGGDGVGRIGGMVVFVPRTAPGDVARVRLRSSKRFARGILEAVEVSSEQRVEPTCRHYVADRCGGCQLQHLRYDAQLAAKRAIVGDAMRRIGRRAVDDPEVESSDAQWRYRRKLSLHLRRGISGWIAGLHPFDDSSAVFDLVDCPITDERVMAVWAEMRPAFAHLPVASALRVSVRVVGEVAAIVVSGGEHWRTSQSLFDAVPLATEIWWKPEHGRPRLMHHRNASDRTGTAFVQINEGVAARLYGRVLDLVRGHHAARVIDAYAGTGQTVRPLLQDGRTVIAIERDREAVASYEARMSPPSRAVTGKVEDHLGAALPADVIVLNPPRAGVDRRVAEILEGASPPPRAIVYVSCDPATLARDLSFLPRYHVAGLRAYDMFPQTSHVETVCELVPDAA